MPPIIHVDHVTKEFRLGQLKSLGQSLRDGVARLRGKATSERVRFKALDDVTFSVEPGEVLGIIGHNGAGKSTLLKILAGISQPTHGSVTVCGRVAPLIEVGAGLVPDMTGRENIFLNATILGMKRAEIRRKFDEIVAFAELEEFIDTPIKRYSSGMQVRLGFAIATNIASDLLIVDEVLAVGDIAFQRKCFDRMEGLIRSEGRTVLLVSHNIRQIERLCSRAILLDHGKISADGRPSEVAELYYEQTDRRIVAASSASGVRRARSIQTAGVVDLADLYLRDQTGKRTESVGSGDAVTLVVDYDVRETVQGLSIGLGLHTTDMIYLATLESPKHAGPLAPGRYRALCSVARLPLLAGVYSVRLGINAGPFGNAVFYGENLLTFQVEGVGTLRSKWGNEGFFALPATWTDVAAYCAEPERRSAATSASIS